MQAASISTPDISGDISRPVVGDIYADVAVPSLDVDASSCPDRLTYPVSRKRHRMYVRAFSKRNVLARH